MLKEFEAISERGGVLGAMETGYQRGKIQEESMYYEHMKHDGSYPIVGVNTFRSPHGDAAPQKVELARSTDDEKKSQLQRLADFHQRHAARSARRAGEAAAGRDRGRQRVRRIDADGARVLAGADHQRVVRSRGAVPPQHVTAHPGPDGSRRVGQRLMDGPRTIMLMSFSSGLPRGNHGRVPAGDQAPLFRCRRDAVAGRGRPGAHARRRTAARTRHGWAGDAGAGFPDEHAREPRTGRPDGAGRTAAEAAAECRGIHHHRQIPAIRAGARRRSACRARAPSCC